MSTEPYSFLFNLPETGITLRPVLQELKYFGANAGIWESVFSQNYCTHIYCDI
jgi:hypothetical protein